jgi:hypothetical protein
MSMVKKRILSSDTSRGLVKFSNSEMYLSSFVGRNLVKVKKSIKTAAKTSVNIKKRGMSRNVWRHSWFKG